MFLTKYTIDYPRIQSPYKQLMDCWMSLECIACPNILLIFQINTFYTWIVGRYCSSRLYLKTTQTIIILDINKVQDPQHF